ncbi:MAG: glycosyltransferase [Planctomycetota bacterium]|nr:MAG: glycosyltransferase [Planctomycetota bacterium]
MAGMGCDAAILIPSKNRHASLAQTLPSALANGVPVWICDQSPQPFPIPKLPPGAPPLRVLHRPDLPGLPQARNALLAACPARLAIFIDDDCDLAPDFAAQACRLADQEDQCHAWGPVIEGRSRRQRQLTRLSQWGSLRDPRRLLSGPGDAWSKALFGCAFAVRRASAAAIGGFASDRCGYCLGEDLDFFLRLHRAGMPCRFATCLRAVHREDSCGRADRHARGAAKARFWLWLARRHGAGNPATLLHLALALAGAASGQGREPASLGGVLKGLCHPQADRYRPAR